MHRILPFLLVAVAQAATTPAAPASPITPIARANTKWPVTIHAAARDSQGNLYVTGSRLIEDVYGLGNFGTDYVPAIPQAFHSVYAAKFDSSGNTIYEITIGGTGNDDGLGIATDGSGNAYVVGSTTSPDFPQKNSLEGPPPQRAAGFVVKLSPAGDTLWSTYFGGTSGSFLRTYASAVAVDADGNAYVTGQTGSDALLVTPGAFQTSSVVSPGGFGAAAFVAKFTPSGTLAYSTYLGSTGLACDGGLSCLGASAVSFGTAIAVDSAGEAYVAGATNEADFPGTGTSVAWSGGGPYPNIPFLVKLKADATGIVFGTYLHGPVVSINEETGSTASALALDANGNAYVAGTAGNGASFPTTSGVLAPNAAPGGSNAFVMKFSPTGALQFSTFLGASGADTVSALVADSSGDVYLSGTTRSADFPTTADLFANGYNYITELDPLATKILNSVRVPGGLSDAALLLAPDQPLVAAGASGLLSEIDLSAPPPATPILLGVGNAALPGLSGGIAGGLVSIYGLNIGPSTPVTATPSNGQLPSTLGGVQVVVNGFPPAPVALLYVSANQINAIMPGSNQITVTNGGATAGPIQIAVQQQDPEIFRNPDGSAVAVNQDGTLNSASNPADRSSIVAIFGTGLLNLGYGSISTLGCPALSVAPGVTVNGTAPLYFGCSPGSDESVFQINFPLSDCGGLSCIITYNGTPGQPFTIYTK